MIGQTDTAKFVIDSLPRTGSTSLASILWCHPDIRCLIEPFHPHRYRGLFHRMALERHSVNPVLSLIWRRWTGIKHVWEANGWPFADCPELNDEIVIGPDTKVLFLRRRNLLRRVISGLVSRNLKFWMGTRQEFHQRLRDARFRELNTEFVLKQIRQDQAAVARRLQTFAEHRVKMMPLYYEDLFDDQTPTAARLARINSIITFLGFNPVTQDAVLDKWMRQLDPDVNRWASPETYRLIPGIERIENEAGSEENGWLFR
jgi:hypothetical protein